MALPRGVNENSRYSAGATNPYFASNPVITQPPANSPATPAGTSYQTPQASTAQQQMTSGYTPSVPPVGATPQATTAPQIAAPPAPTAPGTRPSAMGGTQAGINAAWAYDVATKYNPQTNANLKYDYEQQLDQYQRNGNRVWDWQNGGWLNQAPVAPIYLSTDYDQNLLWTNQNTPGEAGYGQANPDFMRPFTQQNKMYAGTLAPWTSANTNLNYANTAMLPDMGKPATVNFPNGIAPGSGQNAYNMMGVSPTEVVHASGGRQFPNAPTAAERAAMGAPQGGQPVANPGPSGVGGSGQTPQGNTATGNNMAPLMALLSLLFGGGQAPTQPSRQTPFFNNNRSMYYPNTSRSSAPQSTPAIDPLIQLLFGGQ